MYLDNITEGRNRVNEVLSILSPDDFDFLYGEENGGIGFCPLKYKLGNTEYVATVRTSRTDYIKIDNRLLPHNKSKCEYAEIDHVLILVFKWDQERIVYLINNYEDCISHTTEGRKYLVFTIDSVERAGIKKHFYRY